MFFRERNGIKTISFSGFEEVSEDLRKRIDYLMQNNISYSENDYGGGLTFVPGHVLASELMVTLGDEDWKYLITGGTYEVVFEVVERFLDLAQRAVDTGRWVTLRDSMKLAFSSAGSVYKINELGQIELVMADDETRAVTELRVALSDHAKLLAEYEEGVHALISRSKAPKDIVKGFHIVLEGYLKAVSGKNDFGASVNELVNSGAIEREMKKVLDTMNEFRSSRFGTAHSGTGKTPDEIDALWYLSTMAAQINFIERRTQN